MRSVVVLVLLAACDDGPDDNWIHQPLDACAAADYILRVQDIAAAMDASNADDVVAAATALRGDVATLFTESCASPRGATSGAVTADCAPTSCTFSVTSSGGNYVALMGAITRADDALTIHLGQFTSAGIEFSTTDAHASLLAPMSGSASFRPMLIGTVTLMQYSAVDLDATGCPLRGSFDATESWIDAAEPELMPGKMGRVETWPACPR